MKSKATVWLLISLVVIVAGGIFYYVLRPTVSADVNARQNGLKPRLASAQNLTLQEVSKDKYRVAQPVAQGSGFGLQIAYPSGLLPSGTTMWSRDSGAGLIMLDKTYKKVAVYPMTAGEHQINCKIGNQDIIINFSDKGYLTVSPTATPAKASASKTAKPSATATATATITVKPTSTLTVGAPPAP